MVELGPWRLVPTAQPLAPSVRSNGLLGERIRLLGYDLERRGFGSGELRVTLHWRAIQSPSADYSVFVHLVDSEGKLLGQHDGIPRDGAYPTSWWLPNQVVMDQHIVRLESSPTGRVWIRVGMYDPATMVRIPAFDGDGDRVAGDAIILGGDVLDE
jgi:hypothetical protein